MSHKNTYFKFEFILVVEKPPAGVGVLSSTTTTFSLTHRVAFIGFQPMNGFF